MLEGLNQRIGALMGKLSKYKMRQIAHSLQIGDAWITGKTTDGQRWPEGNHYWIIDTVNQETLHVPVNERPSWGKYYQRAGV